MPPPLTECQLELARHCFRFNDSNTYYLNKLSTQEVADTVQCSVQMIRKLNKGGRHFMFNRELPRLWSHAIIAGDATILAVPVNLLHLLTIQEPGEFRRRGRQEGESRPSTPVTPMPQIIMMPPQHYQFPPLAPQQCLPPPAPPGRLSSHPAPEDPADLHRYIAWFKLREPLHGGQH
jgi:hypothetical protein